MMDDADFLRRLKERIEASTESSIDVTLDEDNPRNVAVDFSTPVPRVTVGQDALENPGLARMIMQYAILCLKNGKVASQDEFLVFLRRN
tara:strand:+ start:343 stop:609 length:267 start_codon:yes stop_codon:yes gene_type:complete